MPEFLQIKQNLPSGPQGAGFFSGRKKTISILILMILLLAIPLTVQLSKRTQIFAPKAEVKPIELVSGTGSCVVSTDPAKVNCPTFPIKLTSPLGPPASASSSPSGSPVSSASPVASTSPSPSPAASPSPSIAVSPSASESASLSPDANYLTSFGNLTRKIYSKFIQDAQAQVPYKGNIRTDPPGTCTLGTNGLCTVKVIWDVSNIYHQGIITEIKVRETGTPFTQRGQYIRGEQNAPWITAGGYNFDLYVDDKLYDSIFVKGISTASSPSPSPSVSATATASATLTPSPSNLPGTSFYKLAETETGLSTADRVGYVTHPTLTNFTFSNNTQGTKQIWVEFIGADDSPAHPSTRREHISVELVEPDPAITSLDCSMDISKQNLKLTLNGSRLGNGSGKVTANAKEAQVLTWGATQVSATIKPEGSLEDGKLFKVILTRSDGKALPEITCQVNTTLISLGARLFCREPGKFDLSGVKITLVDENGNKVNEVVTIDKDGIVNGLKTRLQVGKIYALSVKAPFSLRRNALFTAASGTNLLTPEEGAAFILPVGDIAPVILNDGKINTLDHAEIVRQWSVLGTGTKTGDFNRDTKVNSIDWACMRFDFNNEDDKIPDKAAYAASASSPLPQSSTAASPVPSASANFSPSPAAKGRAALFVLEPVEGGSYHNGDEFIVKVNIWSHNEAANLFAAKLSFDPAALEVSRIERGTTLTTWAEEFFDNQSGQIFLTAGLPSPGLKTVEGDNTLMAKIIFKGKKVGNTNVSVTSGSKIYSNVDNSNILNDFIVQAIAITN